VRFVHKRTVVSAVAVSALGIAALASTAQAAFTPPYAGNRCSGSSIVGRGASFQAPAQTGWIAGFTDPSTGVCKTWTAAGKSVTYQSLGSGAGRGAFGAGTGGATAGVRDPDIRFVGTDDPFSPSEENTAEAGDVSDPNDNGELRTIPVAVGAIAVSVNFPDGCVIPASAQVRPNADGTTRFKTSNARWEKAWEGNSSVDTWGELLPGISGNSGGTPCTQFPVSRVVRLDNSGTTFAFKQWLKTINPSFAWGERPPDSLPNQSWPNDSGSTAVQRGTANGNGPLADKLNTVDGGIGYIELSVARAKGFTKAADPTDSTYWVPTQNGDGKFVDPQADQSAGYRADSTSRGANCSKTVFRNVPPSGAGDDPTLANWADVIGVGSSVGYGVCTLTYDVIWDDYADVYGNTNTEQAKARSVKDYETYVTGNGQAVLPGVDYSKLPGASSDPTVPNLAAIAKGGVTKMDWNK
jgi:ABC-type phosphate transport system substrate-binding protein